MAKYELTVTADKTVEKLMFANKEYLVTWVDAPYVIYTLEKSIMNQIHYDYPNFDEDLLYEIDEISTMYTLEVRDLMERLSEYEKEVN